MTVSFFDESAFGIPPMAPLDVNSNSGSRRFNLRKRSHDNKKVTMSSVNSAFLDGLFADVARVASTDEPADQTFAEDVSTVSEEDARLDCSLSVKRSRLSLTKSFSRSGRSYKNLTEVSSPVGVDSFPATTQGPAITKTLEASCSPSMERMNSLHFQLNCVDPSPSPKSVKSVVDIIDMAFPHLPATVSDSSCNKQQDLTQPSDQQVSEPETPNATPTETYGWFVDLDAADGNDETEDIPADAYTRTPSSLDLAFTAPTAPKRVSTYEAEVEWAKAADTVDDVLGDFF